MTQNVYGPPGASIFQASRYQGEYTTLNDLNEIVFTYSGKVNKDKVSGFWVPVRRSTIVQLVASMKVPKAVNIGVTSSVGDIALFNFDASKSVNVFPRSNTIPAGSAGGWVKVIVSPGRATGGEDLVVMLRFLEVS